MNVNITPPMQNSYSNLRDLPEMLRHKKKLSAKSRGEFIILVDAYSSN